MRGEISVDINLRRIIIGGLLLIVGWLVIMAGTAELIPPHVGLGLLAYALSLFGFLLGLMGTIMYMRNPRDK